MLKIILLNLLGCVLYPAIGFASMTEAEPLNCWRVFVNEEGQIIKTEWLTDEGGSAIDYVLLLLAYSQL